jgi:PAS domain S-box-containing protein
MSEQPTQSELAAEVEDLRSRLAESEEVLRAIRNGDVDAVVVTGGRGEQVYVLTGSDRVYRQLVETMSEGAVTVSESGVILYCNVRLARMLSLPLEQVLGTSLRDYLPPADQQTLDAVLGQACGESRPRELSLRTSEGRLLPVLLSASCLRSEGAASVLCLVLTDLTELRHLEQIAAAEMLARSILEGAAEGILVADIESRQLTYANPAICRMLGFTEEELICMRVDELHSERALSRAVSEFEAHACGEISSSLAFPLRRKTGDIILADITTAPIEMNGQTCVVGFFSDVTQRKRAEELTLRQLEELQRWQDVMLGREDRVQELKREVNALLRRLGEPAPYPSAEADLADSGTVEPTP